MAHNNKLLKRIIERMKNARNQSDFRFPSFRLAPIRVPIIDWLPLYSKSDFISDLIAGMTVFVMLVPSGMAFSVLAGMPPVYGLYTATVPLIIYGLLGTSRELSMGPQAITSLLLGSSAQTLGYNPSQDVYIQVILNMSMLCGMVLLLLGIFRLGAMANFLSHSVLTGFVTASALLIALSQLKYILGINIPRYTYTHQTIWHLLTHLGESNIYSILIGGFAWAALYYVKLWKKKNKSTPQKSKSLKFLIATSLANASSLIAIIFGGLFSYLLISNGKNIHVVGYVPPGLKPPGFSFLSSEISVFNLVPSASIIAVVSFAGNWALAKKYAKLREYEVDATQELVSQGMANIVGVLFNSTVASGGLARTVVNADTGARTQISGIISAILVMISLVLFTPVFYYIPLTILGAVIEVAVSSMIDFEEMKKAYRIDPKDCAVMIATCFCTFFIGVSEGIFIGIVLSIVFVVNASTFPYIAHLGKLPDSEGAYYQDVIQFETAKQIPCIAIVRMDASLFFANASFFKEVVIQAARGEYHSSSEQIKLVILDVCAWIDIDLVGINTLVEIHSDLLSKKIQLAIANVKGRLRNTLKTAEFVQKLGEQFLYGSIEDAVRNLPQRRKTIDLEMKYLDESEYPSLYSITNQDVESNVENQSFGHSHALVYNPLQPLENSVNTTI